MRNYELSDTYKVLYDYIIGDLLSLICKRDRRFCIRSREIPYIIGEFFEKNKKLTLKNMSGERLDRHKLASCICGAIIEAKPLVGLNHQKIPQNANEILALYTALSVLKYFMIYSSTYNLNISLDIKKILVWNLRNRFKIEFPVYSENICDTQDYQTNLINSLYWSHHTCDKVKAECFCYDIWAYSKIFYHLELYNKDNYTKCFNECNQ